MVDKSDDVRAPLLDPPEVSQNGSFRHAAQECDSPRSSHAQKIEPSHRPLTLWPLVMIVFFEVSGGPFGTEVGARSRVTLTPHTRAHPSCSALPTASGTGSGSRC